MIATVGRRSFLRGAFAILAAPAIVRVASIMPVRSLHDQHAVIAAMQSVRGGELGGFLMSEETWDMMRELLAPVVQEAADCLFGADLKCVLEPSSARALRISRGRQEIRATFNSLDQGDAP